LWFGTTGENGIGGDCTVFDAPKVLGILSLGDDDDEEEDVRREGVGLLPDLGRHFDNTYLRSGRMEMETPSTSIGTLSFLSAKATALTTTLVPEKITISMEKTSDYPWWRRRGGWR
jgi:hypothetical protein